MATEFAAVHKKRTLSDTRSNPAPEDDHRKRRRNRTTQSCLNCHTSKRMCDRKRPCGRCTQLGLTGLCVYEIDDPSRRSDTQDESSRLRQRVAELEGVIRELKNKPQPRWARSGSNSDEESEKYHARARSCSASKDSVVKAHSRFDPSSTSSNEQSLDKPTLSPLSETAQPDYHSTSLPTSISPPATGSSVPLSALPFSPCSDIHSPVSAPSTGIVTPTEEHSQIPITVAEDQQLTNDIDLASLFMSFTGLLPRDEGLGHADHVLRVNTHSENVDPCSTKYGNHEQFLDGHCGCLNETASYNVVLELSLRLRKAADVLSRSANHRFNDGCPLNRGIADLDTFATTALGNITTSPNDLGPMHLRSRASTVPSVPIRSPFSTTGCISPIRVSAISPPSLRDPRPWNAASFASDPSALCDESFLNWEPSRRS